MFSLGKFLGFTKTASPNVRLTAFGCTDIGRQRRNNEDAYNIADLSRPEADLTNQVSAFEIADAGSLLVVADGIGGKAGGAVASRLAVQSMTESLCANSAQTPEERLAEAAATANQSLRDYAAHNLSVTGMGTTVTAALVKGDTAYIAQVGDSRAYLVRGDSIRQLTKDQTLAQYLSELTPDKPISAKLNNVLMQAVGLEPHLTATVSQVKLRQGDCLLLCSDGLTNKLDEMEIVQVLQEVHNVQVAARWLVAQANQRGGEDNITVVLARFEGNGLTPQSQSWSTSSQTGWKLPAAA